MSWPVMRAPVCSTLTRLFQARLFRSERQKKEQAMGTSKQGSGSFLTSQEIYDRRYERTYRVNGTTGSTSKAVAIIIKDINISNL
jgi:hypothetical protein